MRELDWRGCYQDNLTGKIHPDAFAHPAKMAWGLARRIFEHLLERGWLEKGDLVADPFGGIGVTGLVAASFGCPCILVELEQKFVGLANKSFELHYDAWAKMGKPYPIILQGDSRNFSSIIREAVDSIITSPPFQQALKGGGIMKAGYASPQRPDLPPDWIAERAYYVDSMHDPATRSLEHRAELLEAAGHNAKRWLGQRRCQQIRAGGYGQSEGQVGSMPEGDHGAVISGIVTSPAYAESLRPETEEQTRSKQERIAKAKTIHNGRALEKPSPGKAALGGGYGVSEGQLGAMKEGDFEEAVDSVVTSPPYPEVISTGERRDVQKAIEAEERYLEAHPELEGRRPELHLYGDSEGQIGHLREGDYKPVVNGVVTSPPHEKSAESGSRHGHSGITKRWADEGKRVRYFRYSERVDEQQLGTLGGDTYWEAVSQVYQECFKALKPNGIICVVVKDFVRQKKRVPLCGQTLELLQAVGFKPLERIRAWLVSEAEQESLMPDVVPHYRKERKSFFRRLAERKGSPRIDWEEVLICQKAD